MKQGIVAPSLLWLTVVSYIIDEHTLSVPSCLYVAIDAAEVPYLTKNVLTQLVLVAGGNMNDDNSCLVSA